MDPEFWRMQEYSMAFLLNSTKLCHFKGHECPTDMLHINLTGIYISPSGLKKNMSLSDCNACILSSESLTTNFTPLTFRRRTEQKMDSNTSLLYCPDKICTLHGTFLCIRYPKTTIMSSSWKRHSYFISQVVTIYFLFHYSTSLVLPNGPFCRRAHWISL